jgi:phage major head subunit gpT-like protein
MAQWEDVVTWVDTSKVDPVVFAYAKDAEGDDNPTFDAVSADNYTVEPNLITPDFVADPSGIIRAAVMEAYRPWFSPEKGWHSDEHLLGYDGKPLFSDDHPCGSGTASNIMGNGGSIAGGGWCLVGMRANVGPIMCVTFRGNKHFVGPGMWQTVVFSTTPLNADTIGRATERMASFTSHSGKSLGIKPTHLVTFSKHPEAEALAATKKLELVYLGP